MQVSGDSTVRYIGRFASKSEPRFYRVTVSEEDGSPMRMYADAEVYDKLATLEWGAQIQPVLRIYEGRNGGVGARLIDFFQAK